MLKASFIIGLISGILGIISSGCVACAGVCGSAVDSAVNNTSQSAAQSGMGAGLGIGVALLFLSIFGIVGASLVQKKKIAGVILQLAFPILGFALIMGMGSSGGKDSALSGGIGIIGFAGPAILFLISSILGYFGKPEIEPQK